MESTKTKLPSKLVSLAAALAMTAALALAGPAAAFALNSAGAVDDSGTAATQGAIHVHKYKTGAPSGTPGTGAPGQTVPADAATLDGAQFTIHKLDTAKVEGSGAPAAPTAPDAVNVAAFLATYEDTTFAPQTQTTAGGGIADFTGLGFAYYLLVEDAATATALGVTPAAPSIVTVPYADSSATPAVMRADVHVYPKNASSDDVTKTQVQAPTGAPSTVQPGQPVAPGDKVAYSVAVSIPAPITGSSTQAVTIYDNVPRNPTSGQPTLSITASSWMSLSAVQQSGASIALAPADYTFTPAAAPAWQASWALTASGLAKINAVAGGDYVVKVKADFVADVTNEAFTTGVDASGQPVIVNTAQADVVDGGGTAHNYAPTPGTTTVVAGLSFTKTDNAAAPLQGATFALAPTYADATAGRFLTKTIGSTSAWTETSAVTTGTVTFAGLTGSTMGLLGAGGAASSGWTALSAQIAGMANGTTGTYDFWAVETAAPTGFRLLQAPQKITVNIAKDAAGNVTASAGNAVGIVNVADGQTGGGNFALPNTGGAGTIAFVVVGVALIGSAAYYFARRRKNGER